MRRMIKLCRAAHYLDMSEPEFNKKVRPHITEIKEGRVIKFDVLDLDRWVDNYKAANGRPAKESSTWQKEPLDFVKKAKSGTLTKLSRGSSFEKALENLSLKVQSVI